MALLISFLRESQSSLRRGGSGVHSSYCDSLFPPFLYVTLINEAAIGNLYSSALVPPFSLSVWKTSVIRFLLLLVLIIEECSRSSGSRVFLLPLTTVRPDSMLIALAPRCTSHPVACTNRAFTSWPAELGCEVEKGQRDRELILCSRSSKSPTPSCRTKCI